MKKKSSKLLFYELLDVLPLLDESADNVCLLGGSGNGWPARLAFNPCNILKLSGTQATESKLIDFVSQHKGKLLIGFISYNFGLTSHGIKNTKPDDLNLPDIYFLAYENYLEDVNGKIKNHGMTAPLAQELPKSVANLTTEFSGEISKSYYDRSFDKIIDYIKAGHIYQVNFTHRLKAQSSQDPRILFSQTAKNNRGSMMGYIEGDDFELLSVSPERFIKTNDKVITTTPIKGTRSRTASSSIDKKKLLNDPKEISELNMITDLLRNDLAKISKTGSVTITKPRATQTLSNIMHTYSEVSAILKNDISPIEALISMFPGGSVTGCPKKRAMEIIEQLEPVSRGVYCGSLICIDPNGNLDSNILIRTIIKKGNELVLPVGGGIVFDSLKDNEYQETLDKAKAIINSLKKY